MKGPIHTYPHQVARAHITEGLDCWCGPAFYVPCDECEDGCWKCQDGLIPVDRYQAETDAESLVIVHQDVANAA